MGFLFKHPSRRSLEDLLEAARSSESSDTLEMREIINRFEGLARKIVYSIDVASHLRDDLLNAARMGLVEAVRHHDGRAGSPGFAKLYMRGAALRELQRWVVPEAAHTDDLDELFDHRAEHDEILAAEDHLAPWGGGVVALTVARLDEGQRRVIDLRYGLDLQVKEIAAAVGTSGPAVSQRLATIHRRVEMALAA